MSELGIVSTERAPEAIGPYAQALVCDGWIHTSGQIPLDPESGTVVAGGIEAQTDRVLRNLAEVLAEAGGGLDSVVKTTVYLADLADFARMNEVYARHFGSHRPARSTVQVARLPRDVAVEIDAVARVRG